jgi:hypothetical protein
MIDDLVDFIIVPVFVLCFVYVVYHLLKLRTRGTQTTSGAALVRHGVASGKLISQYASRTHIRALWTSFDRFKADQRMHATDAMIKLLDTIEGMNAVMADAALEYTRTHAEVHGCAKNQTDLAATFRDFHAYSSAKVVLEREAVKNVLAVAHASPFSF